jgi:hypothetical protein
LEVTALLPQNDGRTWAAAGGSLQWFDGVMWNWELRTAADVRSIWGNGTGQLWAGTGTAILHYDGHTWTRRETGQIDCMWGADDGSDIWAIGPSDVLHYEGGNWHSTADSELIGGAKISGSGPEVWAIGNGAAYRRELLRWIPVTSPIAAPTSVYVAERDAVWLFGHDGNIGYFDGLEWTTFSIGTPVGFPSTWGSGPRDIWAVSTDGRLHHFDGVSWGPALPLNDEDVRVVAGSDSDNVWIAGRTGSVQQLNTHLPTPYGGACAEPLRTFCNVSLRGHTAQTTDGPADCGAGAHAGGELAYKIEVPVTGRLTARVTSRHDVDLVALGADARTGCDTDACASDGAGTEVELEVDQGDVYYLVVGARDAAAPFTLDVACEKN